MSELTKTIALLQARQEEDMSPEKARFILAFTRLLAEGKPVSPGRLAETISQPVALVTTEFQQMEERGAQFNERGELIGAALTLTPTRHQFVVDGAILYVWCALDALFLPAHIGKPARVVSTCPITGSILSLTISPGGIETFTPPEAVISVMTAEGCTIGIEGSFCSQVHFFASMDAANQWIGDRPDFAILTVPEAYQLAQQIYIEPVLKYA